jgi:hypothetical protein
MMRVRFMDGSGEGKRGGGMEECRALTGVRAHGSGLRENEATE